MPNGTPSPACGGGVGAPAAGGSVRHPSAVPGDAFPGGSPVASVNGPSPFPRRPSAFSSRNWASRSATFVVCEQAGVYPRISQIHAKFRRIRGFDSTNLPSLEVCAICGSCLKSSWVATVPLVAASWKRFGNHATLASRTVVRTPWKRTHRIVIHKCTTRAEIDPARNTPSHLLRSPALRYIS